jgi:hypothetical protein
MFCVSSADPRRVQACSWNIFLSGCLTVFRHESAYVISPFAPSLFPLTGADHASWITFGDL